MALPTLKVRVEADTKEATRDVGEFSESLDRIPAASRRAASASRATSSAFRRSGIAGAFASNRSRMLTQQLSQVAQQATATGNVAQALAVQAADIGLAFGVAGTIIGAVAGLALPTLISAFTSASDEGETFKNRLESLNTVSQDLSDVQGLLSLSTDDLSSRFGEQAEVVGVLIQNLARYRVGVANDALRESAELAQISTERFSRLADSYAKTAQEIEYLNQQNTAFSRARIDELTAQIAADAERMGEEFGISGDEALRLSQAFAELNSAETTAQINAELQDLNDLMEELGISTEQIPEELNEAIGRMSELGILTAELSQLMAQVASNAAQIGAGDPLEAFGGAGPNVPEFGPWTGGGGGGRGGGGGGGGRSRARIEALVRSLQTEQETLEKFRVDSMDLLMQANAEELAVIGGHEEAKLRLQQEYMDRLRELQLKEQGQTLGAYGTLFGNLANVFQQGSGKVLKVAKAFSVAQGLINSYRAYTEVLADPALIGQPFLRTALAASTLASGLAQVANIKSVSTSGGGGGAAAGGAAAGGAAQAPLNVRVAGLDPDALFTGRFIGNLFDQLNDEAGDRGLSLTVTQ